MVGNNFPKLGLIVPMLSVTVIKLSAVGAGHARDEGAKILHSLNIAGAARSYSVIVCNLMAVMFSVGTIKLLTEA